MRQIANLLACASILAIAAPVVAQAHEVGVGYAQGGYYAGGDWNNGGATYDQFSQEYEHIGQMIRHAASDGSLNRYQASRAWNELRYIRRLAYAQQQRGYYNPRVIQARLSQLHEGLHVRHEAGHRAQDEAYGNDNGRYGYGQREDYSHQGDGYDHSRHDDRGNDDDGSPH